MRRNGPDRSSLATRQRAAGREGRHRGTEEQAHGRARRASARRGPGPHLRRMIFSPFERMVAFRYLRARRREGFISLIAWFSLLGIALGVATLIIVMSVRSEEHTSELQSVMRNSYAVL